MPYQRILYQLSFLAACIVAVVLIAFGAEAACRATWLPGETLWTLRHLAGLAILRVLGQADPAASYCAAGGVAETISTLMVYAAPVLLLLVAGQMLYEGLRHTLRRLYYARRGGHALILGDAEDVGSLVAREAPSGRMLLLGRDEAGGRTLQQRFWKMPVIAHDVATARLGLARARMVAAVSGSDVANLNLIEDLADGASPAGGVILRLESPAMRAAQAARGGRFNEEVSLDQGLFRRGAVAGDPGDVFHRGQYPAHIVLIGGEPGLGNLALHLAGFGYGLEHAPPRFTILGMGGADRSAAIERLRATAEIVTVASAACDLSDPVGLERTLAGVLAQTPAPCAIHCIGGAAGDAVATAMIAAATARSLALQPPKVIAYGRAGAPAPRMGGTAGISYIACEGLAVAIADKDRRDRMARAVHESYLALQRRTRGKAFGTMVAECGWEDLPIAFRDDNRAAADHIDHMIRAVGLVRRPVTGAPAVLDAGLTEKMAAMAHARWMAGKMLAGWRYGPRRDDHARLHDALLPYADLPDTEKDKDRQQIGAIPHILAMLGKELATSSDIGPNVKVRPSPEFS